jgi:hypothetical protein
MLISRFLCLEIESYLLAPREPDKCILIRNINSSKTKDAKIPIQKSPTNDSAMKYLPVKPKEKAEGSK